VARIKLSWEEVYNRTKADIKAVRTIVDDMKRLGHIVEPPAELIDAALSKAIAAVR
jgi:malate dehydrogenase (oxaloacetate-decarboxylating)